MEYEHFIIAHKLMTGEDLVIAKCPICEQYPDMEYSTISELTEAVPIVTCSSATCGLKSIHHSILRWNKRASKYKNMTFHKVISASQLKTIKTTTTPKS